MLTCSKVFEEYPFSHAQHNHDGHCRFSHGHNWVIKLTFVATERDENGFIVDFGKLKYLREWMKENLDHRHLFNKGDTRGLEVLKNHPEFFKPLIVEDASCEGLCLYFYKVFSALLAEHEGDRVKLLTVELFEDAKNSTAYTSDEVLALMRQSCQ